MNHLRSSPYPPKPSDIVGNYYNNPQLSVYQIQRQEQEQQLLELKEYHETEKVGPMPDHIREKLDAVFKKVRVTQDES